MFSLSAARRLVWGDRPEGIALEQQAEAALSGAKKELLTRLVEVRSKTIFSAPPPVHRDSALIRLEKTKEGLDRLLQALRKGDEREVRTQLEALEPGDRHFLYWGVAIQDSLEGKLMQALNHGQQRVEREPMLLGRLEALKVINMQGSSLVEQLYHFVNDSLALHYQERRAAGGDHAEQMKLAQMQAARDLAQYDQMTVLRPLIHTSEQSSTIEKYHSSRVRAWLNATSELYESRGAHYGAGRTQFSVYAPHAKRVECQLTAFGKTQQLIPMVKQSDGTWTVSTDKALPGQTYTYVVTDCHGQVSDRVDPFSFGNIHVPESDTVQSVVVDRGAHRWTDEGWCQARASGSPLEKPLSIYEVHIKSWNRDGKMNLREIAPQLAAYCKEMGFTHVELYGIMEHFWGGGRGYQVSNFFAPYHQSGSYDDMKYFVNYMHEQGLGVIVDWIPAHFDHGGYNAKHRSACLHEFDGTNLFGAEDSNWGTHFVDFSLPEARRLLEASAMWWLKEFHFDAIRADAVSALVRRQRKDIPAGIDFLQKLNDKIHASCPGVLMIAEATDWDPRVTKPTSEGGFGFDLNWSVGASHNMRDYLKTADSARSSTHQRTLERIFHERQRVQEKTISTHSHDDSDDGATSQSKVLFHLGRASEKDRLADIRNFFAWQIFGPNWGHMLHMGDELAQPESWYSRCCKKLPGVQWECVERAAHRSMRTFVKDAIHYYKSKEAFWKKGGEICEQIYSYAPNKIFAYARGQNIVIHNFSNRAYESYDIDLPAHYKGLVERLNSDHTQYGGSGSYLNKHVTVIQVGDKQQLRIKLPPLSTLVLEATA